MAKKIRQLSIKYSREKNYGHENISISTLPAILAVRFLCGLLAGFRGSFHLLDSAIYISRNLYIAIFLHYL